MTHPPVWPVSVQDYYDITNDNQFVEMCFKALLKQIEWFEKNRKAKPDGYYYMDILNNRWESGVDEGVRFKNIATGSFACVDATAHVYTLYDYAERWAKLLDKDSRKLTEKRQAICSFIQNSLFDEETGFFHDIWAIGKPEKRVLAFEGIWPLVSGAATPQQAKRVIDENLMNPDRFLTVHPIATVGICDPQFELRCFRGPAWNSMTYWSARGCVRYGRNDAAMILLERALDECAKQFEQSGTIWEFYHPFGGNPLELQRKPHRKESVPFMDYLGHNPLIAMTRMWESVQET